MIKYTLIFFIFIFLSCGNEQSNIEYPNSIAPTKKDDLSNYNFHQLNIDDYLSSKLIIGKEDALAKNGITSLAISGYDSYLLNGKGQITKSWNISNNYNEYVYDKNDLIQKIFYKQHTTKKSYLEQLFLYDKNTFLESITVNRYDDNSNKIIKSEIIKDENELNDRRPFRRGKAFEPFQIDTTSRMILNYDKDLIFCCGEIMEGENRLIYYYGENGLIDSLIINQIDSTKTMRFEYKYD